MKKQPSRKCVKEDINQLKYISGMKNVIAIDLRESDDYKLQHIPNTINIPYYEFPDRIGELKLNKSCKIFLVCYNGMHSKAVCPLLLDMGYTDVINLGSIDNYRF